MKEIKFRAWDKKNNCWLKNEYHTDYFINFDGSITSYYNGGDGSWEFGSEFDIILMQFTGLKDKDGKEIYEGDIIRYFRDYPLKVVWNEETSRYELRNEQIKNFDTSLHHHERIIVLPLIRWKCEREYEVIGNIYENPELLEEAL